MPAVLQQYLIDFITASKGPPIPTKPALPDEKWRTLGFSLIEEEFGEFEQALLAAEECDGTNESLAEVADALGDLLYVVMWNCVRWGIPIVDVMAEIQRTNMAKFGPGSLEGPDGKVRKPPGWQPPDLLSIIQRARQG